MRLVLFTESSPQNEADPQEQALRRFADSAARAGHYVVGLPNNWANSLPEIIESIPADISRGLYSGFYRPGDEYEQLYEAAKAREIKLPNTPAQSRRVMDLAHWGYPLEDLSAKSWVIESEQR